MQWSEKLQTSLDFYNPLSLHMLTLIQNLWMQQATVNVVPRWHFFLFYVHVCIFSFSHPAKEPADSPGVTFQAQQALHAVPLQTPQPSAPFACQEGGKRPSAQEWDHCSAQSCGRGSGCPKWNCTWKHTAGTPAPQEERPQTWKQGGTLPNKPKLWDFETWGECFLLPHSLC